MGDEIPFIRAGTRSAECTYMVPARYLFALLLTATAACAASSDDDSEQASAEALTEYDNVVQHGTKVETDSVPNASYSSKTRVVGYLPHTNTANAKAQLLKVDRWKEMKDDDGNKIFPSAGVQSATSTTVTAQLTLQGDIPLVVTLKPTTDANGKVTIHITNTTGYTHWLVGQVLAPGKLVIDVMLVPKNDGVIVDATMKVKLEQMEDKAAGFTASLPIVFDWLKATVPHVQVIDAGSEAGSPDAAPSDASSDATDAGHD